MVFFLHLIDVITPINRNVEYFSCCFFLNVVYVDICLYIMIPMKNLFSLLSILFTLHIYAQVGIGTTNPDSSSVLELNSSNSGFLMPRVLLTSLTDVLTIPSPAEGLMVYNLSTTCGIQSGGTYL